MSGRNSGVLLDALENGATVVTPTRRLARAVALEYAARQCDRGRGAWPAPACLAWDDWLRETWRSAWPEAEDTLLTAAQEQLAWETVIAGASRTGAVPDPAGAARLAAEAWRYLHAARIPLDDSAWKALVDSSAFRAWARRFTTLCDDRRWLTPAQLPDRIAALLRAGKVPVPPALVCAGFDEISRQAADLCALLKRAGTAVTFMSQVGEPGDVRVTTLPDAREELRAAAHWVRTVLEATADVRLAVVVPDLAAARSRIEAVFDDVLDPGALLPGRTRTPVYNISLGRPLAEQPVVRDALIALGLIGTDIPLADAGALLRSPFLAGADTEAGSRALLDAALRERGELRVRRRLLARWAAGKGRRAPACPVLAQGLERLEQSRAGLPRRRPASAWAGTFDGLLQALGWPGERTPDSVEYQALDAWRQLLEDYAALALVAPPLGRDAALARLRRLAGERVFQPQTPELPVQILGTLEATGLAFDAIWVAGLSDDVLPAPPRPNPLIPITLSRRHELPRATPQRALLEAQRLLARLSGAAAEVVLSYPAVEGDRLLQPSPLLRGYPHAETATMVPGWPAVDYRAGWPGAASERLADFTAPGIPAGQRLSGGAAIFKDQAACPFQACARHRLAATGLEHPDAGLDPRLRGQIVHALLDSVWAELGDHAGLIHHDPASLRERVQAHADALIAAERRRRPSIFTRRFAAVEHRRIAALALELLELDRVRPPFTVVAREQPHKVRINDLDVRLRIDRVDQLDDGRRVIIDYKTGDVNVKDWLDGRPDEPQLPLYAYATGARPAALVFGRLKAGRVGYVGLGEAADLMPGVKTVNEEKSARVHADWHGLHVFWGKVLYRLAGEFRAGRAELDPKHPRVTCQRCDLGLFCRVGELRGVAVPLGEPEDSDAG